MIKEILLDLLMIIVQIIIVVLGGYTVNFIKAKIGEENFNQYYRLVKTIVMAVEQVFGEGKGADKKQEAVATLKNLTNGKLSDEQLDYLIEAIVGEMNQQKKTKYYYDENQV